MYERRSEPLGAAIPRASSAYEANPQGRQASSWVSLARKDAVGTSSEPNSPRQGKPSSIIGRKILEDLPGHTSGSADISIFHPLTVYRSTSLTAMSVLFWDKLHRLGLMSVAYLSPPSCKSFVFTSAMSAARSSKPSVGKSPASTSPPKAPPYPFNKPDADLVLRSSDNVEFRVRSHILIEASPVFQSMLASSQSAAEADAVNTCRTIDLAEDSAIIEALLRLCYPVVKDVAFWSKMGVKEAESVLRVAFQYEMELPARLTMEHIHFMLYRRPLAVWAVGCRLRLEETATRAAQCSLLNSDFLSSIDPEDLEGVSAGQYFRLRTYQKTGRSELAYDYGFVDPSPKQKLASPPTREQPQYPPVHIPSPDLICIASDGTEFRVRKEPLCAVSSVIRTLVMAAQRLLTRAPSPSPSFSSSDSEDHPGPSDGVGERLPSVQFEYSAAALCTLFRFYNLGTLESFPSDPRAIADVLAATHEYQLQGLHEIAGNRWDSAAAQAPLRAYFAAISRGLDDCARTAARLALNLDLNSRSHYVNDLEDAPAQAYHRLIRYHETCKGIVTAVLTGHDGCFSSVEESATGSVSSSQYWPKLHTKSICDRLRLRPGVVTTLNVGTIFENATTEDAWCSACTPLAKDLISLSDALDTASSDIAAVSIPPAFS
ncbi:hypothetical protein NUW54_g10706 [Trametes sanguinea]|uniref:Uncharacterized protein n=1 Tax=Trametes sanguinea TaxID=158606 RepID=A0ACC1NV71_9APHY|nr:hypothetical protein NUW54_g10706 [Trametes sanguinea]